MNDQIGKISTNVFTDDDGYTKVIYHNTCVVKFNEDWIILNTGGWNTPTTKRRMNQASNQFRLDYLVYQQDGEWYVQCTNSLGDEILKFEHDGVEIKRDF